MSDVVEPLIADFLAWLGREPRSYADVMEGWRTSCPRLTVWEEATDRGLVARVPAPGGGTRIELTERGRARLAATLAA